MKALLGKSAPDFTLRDKNGVEHRLKNIENEFIVIYFYPKDSTPGCTLEAQQFTALGKEFKKKDALVIGISGGDEQSKERFCKKYNLDVLLLSDPEHEVARKYGAFGEKQFMGREFQGIIRSTLVLDRNKRVIKVWESVKADGHAEEVLEYLKRHKLPEHGGEELRLKDRITRSRSGRRTEKPVLPRPNAGRNMRSGVRG